MATARGHRQDSTDGVAEHTSSPWIAVVALAEMATLAPPADAPGFLQQAADQAKAALGVETLDRLARVEFARETSDALEILFLFNIHMQAVGAVSLPADLSKSILALDDIDEIHRGRFLLLHARAVRQRGDADFAHDQYKAVHRLGKRIGSIELEARAEVALASYAHVAGNYPALEKHARRAIKLAVEAKLPRVQHQAHYALLIESAQRGRMGEALEAAWAMIQTGGGALSPAGTDLQTLAQLLLDVGEFAGAKKLFTHVLHEPVGIQPALAAVGGLAKASARLGDEQTLAWAVSRFEEIKSAELQPYELASAMLELSEALLLVGRRTDGERLRLNALDSATRHGFNEFVIKAEALEGVSRRTPSPVAPKLSAGAREVVSYVDDMPEGQLPRRITLAAATATV